MEFFPRDNRLKSSTSVGNGAGASRAGGFSLGVFILVAFVFPAVVSCEMGERPLLTKLAPRGSDEGQSSGEMPDIVDFAAPQGDVPGKAADADEKAAGKTALSRKIIYTATLNLVVEDFTPIPSKVGELAKRFDGYIAGSEISGLAGSRRYGSWKIRVPVGRYDKFLDAARRLGELHSEGCDSKDVSDEFYDLTSRIRNKKREESRLLALLEDATGKLEEILAVERELSRVRGEIERMEGRMHVLNDLTSMTTVNLSVEEIKDYVPHESPGYTTRIRRTFWLSLDQLFSFSQSVSIAVVAILPWLVVVLPLVLVFWLIFRRRKR